jgi:beta-lactamase class A
MSLGPPDQAGDPGDHGVAWSVRAIDRATGDVLLDETGTSVLRTASVGKLALLVEDGTLAPDAPLSRRDVPPVGDSGLWQHLVADELPAADAAALVGAVSDNLATNVLLHHVGLAAVARTASSAGLGAVTLHDVVRDERLPEHPPTLSTASAADLARVFVRLGGGDVVSPAVSRRVLEWLGAGTDLSMVASAFDLDPLAHRAADRGVVLANKTGTDAGVRADAGLVTGPGGTVGYAVVANWDPGRPELRGRVMARMREVGRTLAALVGAPGAVDA